MTSRRLLLVALPAALAAACEPSAQTPLDETPRYAATIRYTRHGVPHVLADDLGSAAFGQAYAYAGDHACILLDQMVKVRSERARWFGPGEDDAHIDSDFAYLNLDVMAYAEDGFQILSDDAREALGGYAAGFNHHLAEVGADDLPPPCAGEPWVEPITEVELLAWFLDLGLYGSGQEMAPYVATAHPAGTELGRPAHPPPPLRDLGEWTLGSNAWGIGGDRSDNGRGKLIANPHFPWEGELKLYESHLTIPGRLNVYGASLMGVVGVLIGFNEHVAWSHTVSYAPRMAVYLLDLPREDPTTYHYGDEVRAMTKRVFTIEVKQEDGTLAPLDRTMYRTHHGPMLDSTAFGVPWSDTIGFTFRDANEANFQMLDQWLAMDAATGYQDLLAAHRDVHGVPWVHTTSADREGNAFYTDGSAVPALSDAALADWEAKLESDYLTTAFWASGVLLLDGSDPANEWVVGPGAAGERGLVPLDEAPQLLRRDFVHNANDNHWSTNPAAPLEGYSPLYGTERTPRSPRTRMNMRLLTETGAGSVSGEDGLFSLDELADGVVMGNRALMAELLRDAVVARCQASPEVVLESTAIDLSDACAALADWDLRLDLASPGAVLWREFLMGFPSADLYDAGTLFAVPFDPADPVGTPNTLAPPPVDGDDPVLVALGKAVDRLAGAGLDPAATMGEWQYTQKGDERIAVPGGTGREGAFNIVGYGGGNHTLYPPTPQPELVSSGTNLTVDGYLVTYGTSFVMAMEFADDGPRARALLTYSQSSDERSEHFADQTRAFSQEAWRDVAFTEEQILADPELVVVEVAAPRP